MLADLVQTTTRDGIRLDGALQVPDGSRKPAIPVDGFCLIHGTGGNFYSSTLFDSFAERLLQLGCAVLRVNTRGHDGISTAVTAQGGRRLGAAYEIVDDCRHDVTAWIEWLSQRVGPRIGVIGHSLGAVKAIYTLAQQPPLPVACLVALSPPRLAYSIFCSNPQFMDDYARAEQLVQANQSQALLEVKVPLPFVITAAGYLEKYGPDERYNFLKFIPGVSCPTLVTYGGQEIETNLAFRGVPEALAEQRSRLPGVAVEIIPGADHFYSGLRTEIVNAVEAWLRSTWKEHS